MWYMLHLFPTSGRVYVRIIGSATVAATTTKTTQDLSGLLCNCIDVFGWNENQDMVPCLTFDLPCWVMNSDQKVSRLSYSVFKGSLCHFLSCTSIKLGDRLKTRMIKIEAAEAKIA